MGGIVADITVSIDGFVTGPGPDLEQGLGRGGEALHRWAFAADNEVDAAVLTESTAATGAVVMGRRTFDFVDGPNGWSETEGYAPGKSFRPPVFVVTHSVPQNLRLTTQFTFVTDGLDAAISTASAAAGDKRVTVMGGADVIRQAVQQRLADWLRLHIAPVLLGSGTRLFDGGPPQELIQERVQASTLATHVTYRIAASNGHLPADVG
jgi:dihydrofolate reductase